MLKNLFLVPGTKLTPSSIGGGGCPPYKLNPLIRCFWFNNLACNENKACAGSSICCANTCSTFCYNPSTQTIDPFIADTL